MSGTIVDAEIVKITSTILEALNALGRQIEQVQSAHERPVHSMMMSYEMKVDYMEEPFMSFVPEHGLDCWTVEFL
jgi:hypothetical protein